MTSPLQLDKYYFTKVCIEASGGHCGKTINISTKGKCRHQEGNQHKWLVELTVILNRSEDEKLKSPYTGEVEIIGFFSVSVDKDYPSDKLHKLVHFNAPALLYGAVREMIFNVTARGPNSHIVLPTVSFIDNVPGKDKKVAENSKPGINRDKKVLPSGKK